jgi:hypothetical protein
MARVGGTLSCRAGEKRDLRRRGRAAQPTRQTAQRRTADKNTIRIESIIKSAVADIRPPNLQRRRPPDILYQ